MSSYDSRFEQELAKRINDELTRLREDLEVGVAIKDYAKYQNQIGRIFALKRVIEEFFPDVQGIINKG